MELSIEKVLDDDRLLRTVRYLDPNHVREDMTATSLAFRLRKNQGENYLSVAVRRLTSYEKSIGDPSKFRLFALVTRDVRNLGCDCIHMPEADNYAHAGIIGNITGKISSQLAKTAVFIKYPSQ